jgi:hypothetical protein
VHRRLHCAQSLSQKSRGHVVGRRSAAARVLVPLRLAAFGSLLVACSSWPAPTGPVSPTALVSAPALPALTDTRRSDLTGTPLDGASLDGALFDNVIGRHEN